MGTPQSIMDNKKLQQIKYYAAHGWPVFPVAWMNGEKCVCGKVNCKSPGKHPMLDNGFYGASIENVEITGWHRRWPDCNWGMRTGHTQDGGAGILVIDIDAKSDGYNTWDLLREEYPELIETVTVTTGQGGQHWWFKMPEIEIRSKAGALGKGIDVRANGGYVLVPPSKTLLRYKFERNPDECELSELPGWILDKLTSNGRVTEKKAMARIGEHVQQGERHQALVSVAGSLHNEGLGETEILAALRSIRDERFAEGDHPVSDDELRDVVQWISTKTAEFNFTDLGNAERFLQMHREDVRYCYPWEKWLIWDGKRWKVDNTGEIEQRGHETIKQIYTEASNNPNLEKRKAIASHAMRSEQRSRIVNMIYCSQPYVPVQPDELDTQPMLLNARNGVIDLRTGDLLPHDRKYLITKYIDVDYDPKAECPRFEAFVKMITGNDPDEQLFLEMAVGYTLTGLTDEHCLFFLFGSGANGKTTFTEAIRRLMGDYALRVDIEALMQSWSTGANASPYIARMAGSRFVLASEIPENRKINESLVKDLTGGDSMTARFLFSNPFTFQPVHKLWIFGNYKPKVTGTDLGFWRRMRVIPFPVTIDESIRRPMSEVLADFEDELPGILTWAVVGCKLWQDQGLTMSETIRQASDEYRKESDVVQQFIEDRCEMHPDYEIEKDRLYTVWRTWCDDNGEEGAKKHTKKWFTRQFTDRGMVPCGDGRKSLKGVRTRG